VTGVAYGMLEIIGYTSQNNLPHGIRLIARNRRILGICFYLESHTQHVLQANRDAQTSQG
jgi:hypothetical protein